MVTDRYYIKTASYNWISLSLFPPLSALEKDFHTLFFFLSYFSTTDMKYFWLTFSHFSSRCNIKIKACPKWTSSTDVSAGARSARCGTATCASCPTSRSGWATRWRVRSGACARRPTTERDRGGEGEQNQIYCLSQCLIILNIYKCKNHNKVTYSK